MLGILSGRVNPFPEPPLARLICATGIVIAHNVIEVFAWMFPGGGKLANYFQSFFIFWRCLTAR